MQRLTARAAKLLPELPEVLELDVNEPEDFTRLREELAQKWDRVDGVLHAIAYAPPDAIGGNFLSTPRASAELAFGTSAYSLKALAEAVAPLMTDGGSIVALDFDASRAWPSYDWMGVAKAALEAVGRYLARDLGAARIRVNLVACGPLKTVAARGIPNFDDLTGMWADMAPLGWDTEAPELVAGPVCFLLSDLAAAITGEILHVDGGLNAMGAPGGTAAGSRLCKD
jgi:enoyl-[acyl-carrier protein] reductase I